MPRIAAAATALPPHVISQAEARAACERIYAGNPALLRLLRVFDHSGVETRHFAFPQEYYLSDRSFEQRNADFIEQGSLLAERAARTCLERAGLRADQVDHFFLVTTTGLATPSLDALVAPRLGLRPDARRWPLFGLGCAGGAGGIIRAGEILRAFPNERALVVAVELCGQVFSLRATNPTDLVGAALFGDGAAAVLIAGDETPVPPVPSEAASGSRVERGPKIHAARTVLFAESKHLMGWDFTSRGMRLVLSQEVTDLVRRRLRPVVEAFLSANGLSLRSITHWILHPGGRRIIEAYREAFACDDAALKWTRTSLARVGNLSSASVLFALTDVLESGRAREGDKGLMVALGPGFGAEMLVLAW